MSSCPFVSLMDIQSLFHERAITKSSVKGEKKNNPSGERKKIKIDPRLLIEQWPTTWTEPTMRVMGSIQSAGAIWGNVHHSSRSRSTKERENSCTLYTHTKPPPLGTSAALYTILIRVQKKGRSNDTIDFLGVEKKIENDFPFLGGMIIIISVSGERCVCVCVYVETFGCLTSSKRCIKPKAAAQNAHDISQKLLTRQFRFPCWQDKVIFLFLFLAERI